MRIPLSKGPSSFLQMKGFSGIKVTPFSHPCNTNQVADPKQLMGKCVYLSVDTNYIHQI